ncbi:class I SAM-dependent methyltransferase [Cytophagaceae bacterium 50C-KIRBA]|uniref:Class I SAM-dependent methyltransferase n=1 Tax=Aquirufa beregesia TaxID=2516556 RepID=A0ABX0EZD1_9BACT|nr:class I SAM-dependent methyltransferase [Aquirufa beregesia]NGZ45473.1 class I SAM-dependent methyltransferase [Aquirufa beregesia]
MSKIEIINQSNTLWNQVSLDDYENHMKHSTVGQLKMLSGLTQKYLVKYHPKSPLFLGIAGGNGLEHIDSTSVQQVVGLDINEAYLQQTHIRFKDSLPQLKLIKCNIDETTETFLQSDFIWAALFLEYVELKNCIQFMLNNLAEKGVVIVTIQSNNGNGAVSESGIEGVKVLSGQFKRIDKEIIMTAMSGFGLHVANEEENILPNGKVFLTFAFQRNEAL